MEDITKLQGQEPEGFKVYCQSNGNKKHNPLQEAGID